jgi:hypothetical protein
VEQVDQQALQRRIDSLQASAAQYAEGNEVMGQLLQGSNKWSDGLATVTGRINNIQGLSVDQWSPENDTEVTLAGRSTDRSKVVRLAQQLEGDILELTFTKTRDVRLYNFQLTVPLDTTKPAAIDYWREQQSKRLAADDATQSPTTAGETADTLRNEPTQTASGGPGADAIATTASSRSDAERESSGSVWTVIVASLSERAAAEKAAQRFRDRLDSDEYPVRIRWSSQNGRYRVGIGTFSSFEVARSVLRDMNGTLPKGAWLLKVAGGNEGTSTVGVSSPEAQSPAGVSSGRLNGPTHSRSLIDVT